MDPAMRNSLEQLADALESIARTPMYREHKESMKQVSHRIPADLFSIAWDIKQIARWNTPSFGV